MHSAAIQPEIQIEIFKILRRAGGETVKIEKEKRCLIESYLLYADLVELNTLKMYFENFNIR